MKKIIATILCAALLMGAFAVSAFAATDIEFSMEGAEGKPGDTVQIKVYMDKNVGTWACNFHVRFNERYFTLLSVENGEVFSKSEFMKSPLTTPGYYQYYAEGNDPEVNITNTGLILTLNFEISKACPNGTHDITLYFPDDGEGWFIDATDYPDFDKKFAVTCTKDAEIIVTGSDATEPLETDKDGSVVDPEETKPAPGIPVTKPVVNEDGETVKNDDGSVLTEEVKDEDGNVIYYETDGEGEIVTDGAGSAVTFVDTTAPAPSDSSANGGSDNKGGSEGNSNEGEDGGFSPYKVILIAAVALVVIGAVIVIIVVAKPKKTEDTEKKEDEKSDEE